MKVKTCSHVYSLLWRNAWNNRYQTMSTQKHESLTLAADRTENSLRLLPYLSSCHRVSWAFRHVERFCGKVAIFRVYWVHRVLLRRSIDWRWNHSYGGASFKTRSFIYRYWLLNQRGGLLLANHLLSLHLLVEITQMLGDASCIE